MPLRYALCAFLAFSLAAAAPSADGPVVATRSGRIQGLDQGAVHAFLGIPFAAPPVGANRWRSPQPVRTWSGTRSAEAFGASCWQAVSPEGFGPWSREYVVQGNVSEDCLTLNVWRPATAVQGRRPVLVFIHGGGFNSGAGSIPIYEGRALASRGILVVTVNYRVNVFGFLAHPDLTRGAGRSVPTNFGLQDIIAALRWVQDNIARFGGDPDRVTIAGQSAGSSAVHDLIAAPAARGLFHRAIAQSGFPGARPLPTLAEAEKDGLPFAADKKAPTLAALRALPPEALQPSRGGNVIRFAPVVDGRLLPLSPDVALRTKRATVVPVLAGFTADEDSALAGNYGSADAGVLEQLIRETAGEAAPVATSLYPAATEADRARSNVQLHRDRWAALLYRWATDRARSGMAPTFGYVFSRVAPGPQSARWGAFHSSEIPYVFGTLDAAPERGFTAADRAFSQQLSAYWVNFVTSGDPNGPGLPDWPALRLDDPHILRLGDPLAPDRLLAPEKLEWVRASMDPQTR